jgi:hypothetical protein
MVNFGKNYTKTILDICMILWYNIIKKLIAVIGELRLMVLEVLIHRGHFFFAYLIITYFPNFVNRAFLTKTGVVQNRYIPYIRFARKNFFK